MAEIIDMPKLSDTMTVGTLVNWLVKEGDTVAPGDILCEVETDKATMELESFVEGTVLKLYVPAGGEVPIGQAICAIGEKGEQAPDVSNAAPASKAKEEPKEKSEVKSVPVSSDLPQPEGRRQEYIPEEEAEETEQEAAVQNDGGRIKISPLARKLATEKGIDWKNIQGTGPGGRIVKKDILTALEKGVSTAKKAEAAPVIGNDIVEAKDIKLTNMRKVIASRLLESKTTIPHFYLETEIDAGPLMALRAALNDNLSQLAPEQGGIKLTVNDFILKATAEALRRVPSVNASWGGDHIKQHGKVHLSFGVAIPDGLVTPVIRDAHLKSLRQISQEAKALIGKARDKKLSPEEMSGSTFTVTNLGMYGITGFYGIINPPNAAILSVGATIKKPVVGPNDQITVGYRMAVGLSCDHRVIDGAAGAEFLMALKTLLETPALMLV